MLPGWKREGGAAECWHGHNVVEHAATEPMADAKLAHTAGGILFE